MLHSEYTKVCNIGEQVWICDYRFNDIDNQPIRHVEPKLVVVCSNEDLPKNKTVYYSDFHFRPVGKNGKTTSQIIAPYDNTGYRSYTGTSLHIFYDEQDCRDHYDNQCRVNIQKFEDAKKNKVDYYNKKIAEINEQINTKF